MKNKTINIKRSKEEMVVEINKPADIQNIQSIYAELKKLAFNRPEIVLRVKNDLPIDLSFIQVIFSLKTTHLEKNQKITLKAPLDETQKNVILDTNKEINIAT